MSAFIHYTRLAFEAFGYVCFAAVLVVWGLAKLADDLEKAEHR